MEKTSFKKLANYKCKTDFGTYNVKVVRDNYVNNQSLAVMLLEKNGEPFADLTVNIDDGIADETMAYVDTNNNKWAEKFIVDNGLGIKMGIEGFSGFCSYPLYKFDIDKIASYDDIEWGAMEI